MNKLHRKSHTSQKNNGKIHKWANIRERDRPRPHENPRKITTTPPPTKRTTRIHVVNERLYKQRNKKAILTLKNNRSRGTDGIPGEALKTLQKHITIPITNIMNKIKNGQPLPEEWSEGTLVHIYKNKGEIEDCNSYRPICLAQIIYKLWAQNLTKRLAKILHTLTSTQQYGYKSNVSTADALIKIESHLDKLTPDTHT